jgi:hypothetical protein
MILASIILTFAGWSMILALLAGWSMILAPITFAGRSMILGHSTEVEIESDW